jgi:SAM-dependent methyltransferase
MSTLRDLLRTTPPHHFKANVGWRAFIQANRMRKRQGVEALRFLGQAPIARALNRVPRGGADLGELVELKQALKLLARGEALEDEDRATLAERVENALGRLTSREAVEPVLVQIEGWPPGMGAGLQRRLMRVDVSLPGPYPPGVAARIVRDLDGMKLAGRTLRVHVVLPPEVVLPAVSRAARADTGRRGRSGPWLSFFDAEGRWSLSSESLAMAQARLVGARPVLDAMCGVGGNSVAFARLGARVVAVERDRGRLALARRNISAQGVAGAVTFVAGDCLPRIKETAAARRDVVLFLDPPWLDGDREILDDWSALLSAELRAAVASWPGPVLLKLPASFDVTTLPGRTGGWTLRYELGDAARGDGHLVKALSAWSQARSAEPPESGL